MSFAFISCSGENLQYASRLVTKLRQEGFNVWLYDEEIQNSDNWRTAIMEAVYDCDAFIFIMSPESEKSKWVKRELAYADELDKCLFPVLLSGGNWPDFTSIQYEDVRTLVSIDDSKNGGKLPSDEFYNKLAEYVTRHNEVGRDILTEQNNQNTIRKKVFKQLSWFFVLLDSYLGRPIFAVLLVPVILGIVFVFLPNVFKDASEPTKAIIATSTSENIVTATVGSTNQTLIANTDIPMFGITATSTLPSVSNNNIEIYWDEEYFVLKIIQDDFDLSFVEIEYLDNDELRRVVFISEYFPLLERSNSIVSKETCLILQSDDSSASQPLSNCDRQKIFSLTIATSEIFWYDSFANTNQDLIIYINGNRAICSASSQPCMPLS